VGIKKSFIFSISTFPTLCPHFYDILLFLFPVFLYLFCQHFTTETFKVFRTYERSN
jgi:hypothetical protein